MITLRLAYRNLVGAGLRTWLNVFVLSFTYVLIILQQGFISGIQKMVSREVITDEIAGGQYWVDNYDPYDPLLINEGHGVIPGELEDMIEKNQALAVLIRQGSMYSEGRMQSILIKGINPDQKILDIPSKSLQKHTIDIPIMIGKIMAKNNSLKIGDTVTLRWRDTNGAFDAADGEIVEIMTSNVPTIDAGQLWVPLKKLQEMCVLEGKATIITIEKETPIKTGITGWVFRDQDYLLKDLNDNIKTRRFASMFLYAILLFLSMLAIFDTQVLAIFRRRKEICTLMALGMVRSKVIALFTLEGTMHGILGITIAALYGIPILFISAKTGIPISETLNMAEDFGFAFSTRLFPAYSPLLIGGTILIVTVTITIVSYLPSRKISGLKPTEALKGRMS
jgi:putative ABC transport system permease protein